MPCRSCGATEPEWCHCTQDERAKADGASIVLVSPSDPFNQFALQVGIFYGSFGRGNIRDKLVERGMTEEQIKALDEALKPLILTFYKPPTLNGS